MVRTPAILVSYFFPRHQARRRETHILDIMQRCSKLREMPAQHVLHRVVLNPVHALSGVHLGAPGIASEELIRLDAAASHKDKHTESSVAEAEALGKRLAQRSDEEIHGLDVAVVDALKLGSQLAITASQLNEAPCRWHVEEAAEGVVARHAALAVAQDVDGAHVQVSAFGELLVSRDVQVSQKVRHVVGADGSRVVDSERVEDVCEVESQP